ncbi:MAG: glycosyltransferase, partial [Aquaticitalea sp.]
MNPTISVIVPVYDVERFLHKCIDSIINQTYKHLEIILVDDGSPDNCGLICDAYVKKDPRIKVIHKKNKGLSAARNSGLEIATGDYIGFVDSDDWVHEKMFEALITNAQLYQSK